MIIHRIAKVEKFLRKEGYEAKRRKDENPIEYLERLHEIEMQWEEDNQQEFPV